MLGESVEKYSNITDALYLNRNALRGLETEHLRLKKLEKIAVLLTPVTHKIGHHHELATSSQGNINEAYVKAKGECIQLRNVLKRVFRTKGAFKSVIKYKKSLECEKEVFSNFIQEYL